MKGLDLRGLKKISSDDKMTVFKHDLGHEVKIAHAGLSPKMLADLKGLPMKGQKPQKMADGGTPNPQPNASPDDDDSSAPQSPVTINIGGQPNPQPNASPSDWQGSAGSAPSTGGAQGAAPTPQAPPGAPSLSDNTPTSQAAPTPAQEVTQPAQPQDQEAPDPTSAQPQAASTPQQAYQNNMENLSTENSAFAQDLNNGHITPETYSDLFAKKSTLGKIGMIFGLMVGGAGAGLAHQRNALLDAMNQEINNDLEAQKQSKNNAQNWLRLSQQHQQNMAQQKLMGQQAGLATAQTKLAQVEASVNSVALAKDRMQYAVLHNLYQKNNMLPPGPQQMAGTQALQGISQAVDQDVAKRANEASTQVAQAHQIYGNQDEQNFTGQTEAWRLSGQPNVADDLQRRHFPGMGEASVPLSQDDRNKLTAGLTFQNQLDRFMQWSGSHSGDLNPEDVKYGKALAAGLQGAYRQATNGGVYKAGEQDFIGSIIDSDPTKFFNKIRTIPQLQAVKTDSAAQLDQLSKSMGFPGYSGGTPDMSTGQKVASNEKQQTGTSKSGKPIVLKNGKWVYQ